MKKNRNSLNVELVGIFNPIEITKDQLKKIYTLENEVEFYYLPKSYCVENGYYGKIEIKEFDKFEDIISRLEKAHHEEIKIYLARNYVKYLQKEYEESKEKSTSLELLNNMDQLVEGLNAEELNKEYESLEGEKYFNRVLNNIEESEEKTIALLVNSADKNCIGSIVINNKYKNKIVDGLYAGADNQHESYLIAYKLSKTLNIPLIDIKGLDLFDEQEQIIKEFENMTRISYKEVKEKYQKQINDFPCIVAFSKKSVVKKLSDLNVNSIYDLKQIIPGYFIRKSDVETFKQININKQNEIKTLYNGYKGYRFAKSMFKCELNNQEYCITYDLTDTLEVLNLTLEEIKNNKNLRIGLKLALKEIRSY